MVWDPPLSPNAWLRWEVVSRRLPPDARDVLEVGCGQGGFAARLAARYRYVGVEPDPRSYAVAAARLGGRGELRRGDVAAVPANEEFDLICAFEVLEHIQDDRSTLGEWVRRLRPGGLLIVSTPAWRRRYAAADEMVGHFRRYDPADLDELLAGAGLEIVEVAPFGAPFGYVLEAARNLIGTLRRRSMRRRSVESRTAESGRLLQPPAGLVAAGVYLGVLPFAKLQHLFRGRGPGLLGVARRPASAERT